MIKSIQRLRRFGVFDDFAKTATLPDFADKNIIYGWNYSGKTTLSRLFDVLGSKVPNKDFPDATFTIIDQQNVAITDSNLAASNKIVEVFNSDFVLKNLSWNGEAFQPILLLGDESIEAERKISVLTKLVARCRAGYARKRDGIIAIDNHIAETKTTAARRIKQTLQLVEAFTASHLTSEISRIAFDPKSALLTDTQYKADMTLALTAEKDKLQPVRALVVPSLSMASLYADALAVVAAKPAFSAIIEYLRTNRTVSDWVEKGLAIHQGKDKCEFCRNDIAPERINELHAHFSKDIVDHKATVTALAGRATAATLNASVLNERDFAPLIGSKIGEINNLLSNAIDAYNQDIQLIAKSLASKAEYPFEDVRLPVLYPGSGGFVLDAFERANTVIKENNGLSDSFAQQKKDAIQRLKRHFAAEFYITEKIERADAAKVRLGRHRDRYQSIGLIYKEQIKDLQATINQSQKGRARINERIGTLLGTGSVEITVIQVENEDRFQLTRHGVPAKNLSDGERTAIAFAFFLTKLEEHKDLDKVIVFIDDPISSLDSNHVFQVYSMIEAFFFKLAPGQGGNKEWVTACKQIFISTHNFEFFSLLKDLPCKKNKCRYFMVRRQSPKVSVLEEMPASMLKYTSEYHYLFGVIHAFHVSPDKANVEVLLGLPNAMRRFLELYTYMRLPLPDSTVSQRVEILFGKEKATRVIKLLHHFSHLEIIERVATHTQVIADIGVVVNDLLELLQVDKDHYDALLTSIPA